MGKFIDLTGQDFGRLKVLSRDKSIKRNEAQISAMMPMLPDYIAMSIWFISEKISIGVL